MRIAVMALKGGSGKTLLSIALSEAAVNRYGSALLVDADAAGLRSVVGSSG